MTAPRRSPSGRLADRVDVAPILVWWLVDCDGRGWFGRPRVAHRTFAGRIVEISISGAAIEGPATPALAVGGSSPSR
jgi:hypothetical protein